MNALGKISSGRGAFYLGFFGHAKRVISHVANLIIDWMKMAIVFPYRLFHCRLAMVTRTGSSLVI